MSVSIRVELPSSLCLLANLPREVTVSLSAPPTQRALVDALEGEFPALRGTLRDPANGQRRPLVRFFACEQDVSHGGLCQALPGAVVEGTEVFMVVGAIAGG